MTDKPDTSTSAPDEGLIARLSRARPTKPGEIYGVPGQGNTLWLSALSIAAFFLIWWLVTMMGWVKPLFVPSPMAIAEKFISDLE